MTEGDLEIYLRALLKERKYPVVVDDVWKTEAWESLKREFTVRKNGSRFIIATCKEDVAERADDREMESLAKDMVENCRDLPLAIIVLSGLLSHKKEDQVVNVDNIIRLWMDEGFIPRGEERMDDVAEGFLNESIRRSLLQVANTF
uniref:Uncharacterized protein n=1 Tax=Solanum lycopersicum TaxID=4081 RepID=K4BR28_SOLLC